MPLIIGPRRISQVNQVAIPVEMMRLLELRPGDSVFFEVVEGLPPEIRLVPDRTVGTRYRTGREVESDLPPEQGVRARAEGRRTTAGKRTPGREESREGRADAGR